MQIVVSQNQKSNDTASNPNIVVDRNASNLNAIYQSPLPAVANRQSCDGQGIYFLSDGEPNNTTNTRSATVMSTALGSTLGANFTCSGGLSNTTADSGWACMGEFAKRLFDKTKTQLEFLYKQHLSVLVVTFLV